MEYTTLGRSGLRVSRLCLGTMNYGPQAPEEEGHRQMDRALELGIQFFDTADVYGWKKGEGWTEQIIGRWFAQGGGRRERVVLATKVYAPMAREGENDPNLDRGLSARKIVRCCEDSLRRMKTTWIDLYQMHHVDRGTPWDEIWQAMETLTRQGKILYCGSSNFAGWHIATAQQEARRRNFQGLVGEQCKYSLAARHVELEVLPAARFYGLGVIPWSPLDGGLLGGVLAKTEGGRRGSEGTRKRVERLRPRLEQWEALCKEMGERPADVALAWVLAHPAVTAPIIGPRTMGQLEESLRALAVKLDAGVMKRLDEIWPPAGSAEVQGTATGEFRLEGPEAWAW